MQSPKTNDKVTKQHKYKDQVLRRFEMQKLAEICIRRPVFATMIVLSLVVVGAASFFRLGVDRFPSVDLPTVSVRTGLPGGSPEEVESLVTQQIEEVVNTVDGIDELRSISGQGTFVCHRHLQTRSRSRISRPGRSRPRQQSWPQLTRRCHAARRSKVR